MERIYTTRPPLELGKEIVVDDHHVVVDGIIAKERAMCIYRVKTPDDQTLVVKEILPVQYKHLFGTRYLGPHKHKGGYFELRTQQDLSDHPNIVKCFGGQRFAEDKARFHLLMEYAPHGDLLSVVKTHGPADYNAAWRYYDQIVSALGHMHRDDRIHAAVHPRNVFVFSGQVCKLGDFGNGHFVPAIADGRHLYHHFNAFQLKDLEGAAHCALLLLLGMKLYELQHLFMDLWTPADVEKLFMDHPEFHVMMMEDCWYLRQFVEPYPDNHTYVVTVPIPPSYGLTRKQISDEINEAIRRVELERGEVLEDWK